MHCIKITGWYVEMHYLVNIFHPTSFHHKFCFFFKPLKSRKFLARLSVWAQTWRIFKCDLTLSIIEIDLAPQSDLFSGRSTPAAGGVLFSDKRMGLCCFMRSYYHDWIDYRTGKLSTELLEWSRTLFEILG